MPTAALLRRSVFRVCAWLAAGATVPLLGVLSDPLSTMPGSPRSDLPKHIWSYWHTLHHLSSWPETTAIGTPYGGEFLDVMLVPGILMAPVTAMLGPVVAANLWVWLSVFGVGAATAALAHRVVGSERSAVVAGLIAQAAPYLAGYGLGSGVHERLAIWVFPVVWLGLLSWRDQGRIQALVGLALGLFVATVGCQVYGVFTLCMLILGLPWWWPGVRRIVPALAAVGLPLLAALAVVRGPTVSSRSLVPQHEPSRGADHAKDSTGGTDAHASRGAPDQRCNVAAQAGEQIEQPGTTRAKARLDQWTDPPQREYIGEEVHAPAVQEYGRYETVPLALADRIVHSGTR